ncbi:TPA: IS3-like element ISSag12 family transposase, partial [Streptococcus agalactiae]
GADIRTKRQVIDQNKDRYSISAMCKVLGISRQTYYYQPKEKHSEAELEEQVEELFMENRKICGTRKLKNQLEKRAITISRRKIGSIMKRRNLQSAYTVAQFKAPKSSVNEAPTPNLLNREFSDREPLEAIVTDLTYVRVGKAWHYICAILDLFNREIIGYSCGPRKDAQLVKKAFQTINYPLNDVAIFHTDRGKEFDNQLIDQLLESFEIERSLSRKGNPYDNAVAESTYKSMKIEFIRQHTFETLDELRIQLSDYIHWWNYLRIHGSLDNQTPIAYRQQRLAKRTLDNEHGCDSQRQTA